MYIGVSNKKLNHPSMILSLPDETHAATMSCVNEKNPKGQLNLTISKLVIAEFRQLMLDFGGKDKGLVGAAAILAFLEIPPGVLRGYMSRVGAADTVGEVAYRKLIEMAKRGELRDKIEEELAPDYDQVGVSDRATKLEELPCAPSKPAKQPKPRRGAAVAQERKGRSKPSPGRG